MARFNNDLRLELVKRLLIRDGFECQSGIPNPECKKTFETIDEMKIDHIDGSPKHNCFSNLRLCCHSCNVKLGIANSALFAFFQERDTTWLTASWYQWGLDGKYRIYHTRLLSETGSPDPSFGEPVSHGIPMLKNSTLVRVHEHTNKSVGSQVGVSASERETEPDRKKNRQFDPASLPVVGSNPTKRKKTGKSDLSTAGTITWSGKQNVLCEKPFNSWLNLMLDKGETYTYEEWANAGANLFECSPETIKRYLDKRLDIDDCNPINGDLTLRANSKGKQCVCWKDTNRWYFNDSE